MIRIRLILVGLSALAAGFAPASADSLPLLDEETYLTATGSAQGTFRLERDMVLQTHAPRQGQEDAYIRSSAAGAALVLESVGAAEHTLVAFVATASACVVPSVVCQMYESDLVVAGQVISGDSGDPPALLLRPGIYRLSILAKPDSSTTASLWLAELDEAGGDYRATRPFEEAVAERIELHDPTEGSLEVDVRGELSGSEFSGTMTHSGSGVLGVGGLAVNWQTSENPHALAMETCLRWDSGSGSDCGASWLNGSCLCPTGRAGGWGPRLGFSPWGSAVDHLEWEWSFSGHVGVVNVAAFLFVWPYAT